MVSEPISFPSRLLQGGLPQGWLVGYTHMYDGRYTGCVFLFVLRVANKHDCLPYLHSPHPQSTLRVGVSLPTGGSLNLFPVFSCSPGRREKFLWEAFQETAPSQPLMTTWPHPGGGGGNLCQHTNKQTNKQKLPGNIVFKTHTHIYIDRIRTQENFS